MTRHAAWPPGWWLATWPGNPRVRGLFTGRCSGCSGPPYDDGAGGGGMNLGAHVGDEPAAVAGNRDALRRRMGGVRAAWLEQVHGVECVELDARGDTAAPRADAALVTRPGVAASVLVADCLPVLLAAPDGAGVAAAHAGWRGLAGGVLERSAAALAARCACPPARLQAWLGPAIGPAHFEVGDEVRDAFCERDARCARAFVPGVRAGKWMADLFELARMRLLDAGLEAQSILGGGVCTFSHPALYYSFRRDRATGRQAALAWLI